MKKLVVVALAASLSVAAVAPARALPQDAVATITYSNALSTTAAWVVAGAAVSMVSLTVCAHVVGTKYHRQLTSQEALAAMVLPLSCMWMPPKR